jgi:hypothetical protein
VTSRVSQRRCTHCGRSTWPIAHQGNTIQGGYASGGHPCHGLRYGCRPSWRENDTRKCATPDYQCKHSDAANRHVLTAHSDVPALVGAWSMECHAAIRAKPLRVQRVAPNVAPHSIWSIQTGGRQAPVSIALASCDQLEPCIRSLVVWRLLACIWPLGPEARFRPSTESGTCLIPRVIDTRACCRKAICNFAEYASSNA